VKNPLLGFEELLIGIAICAVCLLIFANIAGTYLSHPWSIEISLYRRIGRLAFLFPMFSMGFLICAPFAFLSALVFSRRAMIYGVMVTIPVALLPLSPSTNGVPWRAEQLLHAFALVLPGVFGAWVGASRKNAWRMPTLSIDEGAPVLLLVARAACDISMLIFFLANAFVWNNVLLQRGHGPDYPNEMLVFFLTCFVISTVVRWNFRHD
jgi:hypothetical protein